MTPDYTATIEQRLLHITTHEIEIGFSLDDGGLRLLRRRNGPNVIAPGEPYPPVDVALGSQGWLGRISFTRYLSHQVAQEGAATTATIVIGLGPLKLYDRYYITGTLIARRLSIEYAGEGETLLRGVRLAIPWLRVGSDDTCLFDAPGNSVRPRVALAVAASQREGVLPRRFFAPGLREGRALESAPDYAAGLLALHDRATDEGALIWCCSTTDTVLPHVEGNDQAVSMIHTITVADRLTPATALSTGTQYILLMQQPWPNLLGAFSRTWQMIDRADAPSSSDWLHSAAIYEAHPAQFGGLRAMALQLQSLTELGITTICLLPVWSFERGNGAQWDGDWHAGDPYAVFDHAMIDPSIDGAEGLQALIAAAHALDMRVILDLPWIGCAANAPAIKEHPEWFCHDEDGSDSRTPENSAIVPFAWANQELRETMHAWALELLRAYECDGFRITTARTSTPNWSHRLPYHASAGSLAHLQVVERLRADMRAIRPDAALIADRSGPACVIRYDTTTDELAHHMFIHTALSRLTPAELGLWLSDVRAALPGGGARICYTESHHTRLTNPLADGLRGSRISRMLLAGMVFCGYVPQIWSGQEEGEEQFIRQLLAARRAAPALIDGQTFFNAVGSSSPQIFAVLRVAGDSVVAGILNMSPHRHTVTLSLPVDQLPLDAEIYMLTELIGGIRWREHERDTWGRDVLRAFTLSLAPFGAYCFAIQPAPDPE
jgi:hypothetical protein